MVGNTRLLAVLLLEEAAGAVGRGAEAEAEVLANELEESGVLTCTKLGVEEVELVRLRLWAGVGDSESEVSTCSRYWLEEGGREIGLVMQ